ncbi:mediator of RNA polymerase II transcription subunit 9-like [Phalaenopsis equestris]|uniref:mediator of RNA polymerase II transcription subunit 9-like n=1 Tax=Phalaenopsis equestris TaxID=78828 RepID=UPI0009E4C8E0|nr:mediator of RNA polymerase II transcription subunit 9-like [Phalaenopsis equestris]
MDHHFGGGNWMMVPTQNSIPQDHSSLQSQYYQQQQHQLQQNQLNQQLQQQQQQQQHDHDELQSLTSHFHLLHVKTDHHFGGGNWMMVPTQNSIPQDHSSLQSQYYQQQQHQLQQHQLNQQLQQQQQQQQHDHDELQSLTSHFHLLHVKTDHHFGGGNWMMVPTQNSIPQDHSSLQSQYYQQQQHQLQQHQLNQQLQQQQQQQQHDHDELQSLTSHFHLLHLAESMAEAVESGTTDQYSEALDNELNNNFEKCQQLLNAISASFTTKTMTVEGLKRKFEEAVQLLDQKLELTAKYRRCIDADLNM